MLIGHTVIKSEHYSVLVAYYWMLFFYKACVIDPDGHISSTYAFRWKSLRNKSFQLAKVVLHGLECCYSTLPDFVESEDAK